MRSQNIILSSPSSRVNFKLGLWEFRARKKVFNVSVESVQMHKISSTYLKQCETEEL